MGWRRCVELEEYRYFKGNGSFRVSCPEPSLEIDGHSEDGDALIPQDLTQPLDKDGPPESTDAFMPLSNPCEEPKPNDWAIALVKYPLCLGIGMGENNSKPRCEAYRSWKGGCFSAERAASVLVSPGAACTVRIFEDNLCREPLVHPEPEFGPVDPNAPLRDQKRCFQFSNRASLGNKGSFNVTCLDNYPENYLLSANAETLDSGDLDDDTLEAEDLANAETLEWQDLEDADTLEPEDLRDANALEHQEPIIQLDANAIPWPNPCDRGKFLNKTPDTWDIRFAGDTDCFLWENITEEDRIMACELTHF